MNLLPMGKGVVRRNGEKIALLAFGTVLSECLKAAEVLNATVADMRFAKPLDESLIAELSSSHDLLVTVEENVIAGGAGSAVLEFASHAGLYVKHKARIINLGLPDAFQDQASRKDLLHQAGLSADAMIKRLSSEK